MIDHHTSKFNFQEIFPPVLMRKESMVTTGQLPKFEEDMYHTELDNLYLAPTAEVPITNIHRDEIIDGEKLQFIMFLTHHVFEESPGLMVKTHEAYSGCTSLTKLSW